MGQVFKINVMRGGRKVRGRHYHGKIQLGPKRWKRVKLFTDKTASERRLGELQRQADMRSAGVTNSDLDRLRRPTDDLLKEYLETLAAERKDEQHVRIAGWITRKLVELAGWRYFSD